eukprot:95533_1
MSFEDDDEDIVINEDDELGAIYLNRWIDCQDEYHKWYEAQITEIDPNSDHRKIKVHYKGWKSKFDTWIDLNNEPERARLLHTFTEKPAPLGEVELNIETKCDCLDSTDKWYEATIVDMNEYLVRIHYVEWDSKYDEWINKDSYRIAPLHTMTTQKKHKTTTNNNKNKTVKPPTTTTRGDTTSSPISPISINKTRRNSRPGSKFKVVRKMK